MTINYFSTISSGNSTFLRTFSIPLAEELEKIEALKFAESLPNSSVFELDTRAKGSDLLLSDMLGVLLFLPGWFAVKVLNDLYDLKIKSAVQNVLKKADSIELLKTKKKKCVFTLLIYNRKMDLLLVLAATGNDKVLLDNSISELNQLIPMAAASSDKTGHSNQVHLYLLENGKININPYLHKNLDSVFEQLNA